MDPITVTIVAALSSGAVAAAKDVATQAIKDAYSGLKTWIVDRYKKSGPFVEALEADPESQSTQEVLAKQLHGVESDPEAKDKAVSLLDSVLALEKEVTASTVGQPPALAVFDFKKLRAARNIELKNIDFTGTLFRGDDVTVGGDFIATDLRQRGSGEQPPK